MFQFLVSTRPFNARAFLISCLFLKKHKIIAVPALREHWPAFSHVKDWHMEHEASKCLCRPPLEQSWVQSILEGRRGESCGDSCSGMKVQISVFLSRALQSVMQECCMCFPGNTEEESSCAWKCFFPICSNYSLEFSAALASKGHNPF